MKTLYINFKNGEELEINNVNEKDALRVLSRCDYDNENTMLLHINNYVVNAVEINYMEFIGGEE